MLTINQQGAILCLLNINQQKGVCEMTNTERLENLIRQSGLKKVFIAEKLNISTQALRNKTSNISQFLPSEINKLCDLLGITSLQDRNDIFFAEFVEDNSTEAV